MGFQLVKKKSVKDVAGSKLEEFELTGDQRRIFLEGVELFNRGKFWDAHESWEAVWRQREEDGRIFLQGIIQAAAGLHLVFEKPRPGGAMNNFAKAQDKLSLFPTRFLGLDVEKLRENLRALQNELDARQFSKTQKVSDHLRPRLDVLR